MLTDGSRYIYKSSFENIEDWEMLCHAFGKDSDCKVMRLTKVDDDEKELSNIDGIFLSKR